MSRSRRSVVSEAHTEGGEKTLGFIGARVVYSTLTDEGVVAVKNEVVFLSFVGRAATRRVV